MITRKGHFFLDANHAKLSNPSRYSPAFGSVMKSINHVVSISGFSGPLNRRIPVQSDGLQEFQRLPRPIDSQTGSERPSIDRDTPRLSRALPPAPPSS